MLKAETVSVWSERVGEADFNKKKQALNVGYKQKLKKKRHKKNKKRKRKTQHRDPLEELVSVWFQMNSRAVRLWR